MSESDEKPKRSVFVPTDIPTAEIVMLDQNDTIVARGLMNLRTEVEPGIYQLRYRIGEKVADQIVAVRAGKGEMQISPPKLPLDTPAPVPSTSADGQTQWSALVDNWSSNIDIDAGAGSQVFVFINQSEGEAQKIPRDRFERLSLRTIDGETISDLSEAHEVDGSLGLGFRLDAGSYLLRFDDSSGPAIEQTVVACEGWQTQLFFRPDPTPGAACLDLTQGSVRMSSVEKGWKSDERMFRWTEAARQSLATRRYTAAPVGMLQERNRDATQLRNSNIDEATIRGLLHEKFGNPMLGIYGAHLLLLNQEPDRELVKEVAENLRYLVGDHPDVMALWLYLRDNDVQSTSFPVPPMLRSSWDIIVKASGPSHSSLVPTESYSFKIGGRLCGSGAGLAWRVPPMQVDQPVARQSVDWTALASAAANLATTAPAQLADLLKGGDLMPAERELLGQLGAAGLRVGLAKSIDGARTVDWLLSYVRTSDLVKNTQEAAFKTINPEFISRATGIPYPALQDAAATLSKKLQSYASHSVVGGALTGLSKSPYVGNIIGGLAKKIGYDV